MEKDLSSAIQRVLAGEIEAFEEIVETCQGAVYSLALRLLGDCEEAKDVAQEVFIRAFRNLSFYNPQKPFFRWLLTITYNTSMDWLRRRSRELKAVKEVSNLARGQSQKHDFNGVEVEELLEKLEQTDRAILILKYWYGLTCSEIGEIVGMEEGAVKVRLYRARLRLAEELRKEGWLL